MSSTTGTAEAMSHLQVGTDDRMDGDDSDGGAEDEEEVPEAARRKPSWLPPAADAAGEHNLFGRDFEEHFWVPPRLMDKSLELVETANDFHYAMVNDHPRNEFYRLALAKVVVPDTHVLEIGTGSGLLAMIAAKQGARVTAVEANRHMAALARSIIAANGLSDRVRVINKLSTDIVAADLAPFGPVRAPSLGRVTLCRSCRDLEGAPVASCSQLACTLWRVLYHRRFSWP